MHRTHALAATALAVVLVAGLAGCAPERSLEPEPTVTTVAPQPEPTVAPSFDPLLTAEENLAYFDSVNRATIKTEQDAGQPARRGKKLINGLVAAGFPKDLMEVTPDGTAIGLDSDNVQFSVKVGSECLIGQFGNVGYNSTVAPVLGTGNCLIGVTRPINW